MKVWGLTAAEIQHAAASAGVRLSDEPVKDGRAFRFTLRTHGPTTTGLPVKWGRRSRHQKNKDGQYRRVPGAVCWHGHRAFMRACYRINGRARIKTSMADYRGQTDFERSHRDTFGSYSHWGSQPYGQSCDCQER